ncbi:aldehyde dehydrogenase family protein, partial [Paracoccus sp. APAP_BH8]
MAARSPGGRSGRRAGPCPCGLCCPASRTATRSKLPAICPSSIIATIRHSPPEAVTISDIRLPPPAAPAGAGRACGPDRRSRGAVAQVAGENGKKVVLELGGSDPFLVFEDAELDKAVKMAVLSRFSN